MRLLAWIIGLPLAVLVTVFAVANRAEIRFDLWPLPFGVELPAYLAVLVPLALGLAAGFLLGWASGLKARLRAGSLRRQLDAARKTQSQA
ncbi:conserved exported protein of unknown function [Magnetospirillum sp. XM-1]|uniref:lipopolysaccharide assembly protein LapA domain-containing protein n=1 Tax=Magnetospirillum sp. XM-1 TaxID=1663591 RepID=UPI00073DCFB1|nr:LapA family protein [Magnetospirillum sp. XM-1]CUW38384.1 conserved exported protein of unknown function [Magnetospirillum sp. XM-1]